MAGNIVISYRNWLFETAFNASASSQVTSMPISNIANPQARRRWRAPQTNSANFTIDLGNPRAVGIIALQQPDDAGGVSSVTYDALAGFANTDLVRHEIGLITPGDQFDTGTIPGNWNPGYGISTYMLDTPVLGQYWKSTLTWADPLKEDLIDIGIGWIGPVFRPQNVSMAFGWSESWQDESIVSRAPRSGLDFVDIGPRRRILGFGIQALTTDEARREMRMLQRIAGRRLPILVTPDIASGYAPTESMIGRLTEVPAISQPDYPRYEAYFQLEQVM